MAQQKSVFKFEGQLGGVTFYKTPDGFLVREKGGVAADRIRNDPSFARTRENAEEFGRGGKASKVLRNAFRSLILNTRDSKMISRLTRAMMTVLQADSTSIRGKRNVMDGETELLKGFEFNDNARLDRTLFAPYTATIDRAGGTGSVNVPSFVPADMMTFPQGATHYRVVSGAAEVDFETGEYLANTQRTPELLIEPVATANLTLSNGFTPNATAPVFVVLGIEFLQLVNGVFYPLNNGAFNPLSIVLVDGGA